MRETQKRELSYSGNHPFYNNQQNHIKSKALTVTARVFREVRTSSTYKKVKLSL
jgi:hypothetical protein